MNDVWPVMPDGKDYDGTHLLQLARRGQSPFRGQWDVLQLVREIEEQLGVEVVDLPRVTTGSNNYVSGFSLYSLGWRWRDADARCIGYPHQDIRWTNTARPFSP